MHLITFVHLQRQRIGILDREGGYVVDLGAVEPRFPDTMLEFIASGDAGLERARRELQSVGYRLALSEVTLLAPIPVPARNILCVGKNYRDHAREVQSGLGGAGGGDGIPEEPIIFTKAPTTVIGPLATIPASLDPTATADYEAELAVVIGEGGRGIPVGDAMRHVYGYTLVNDVTSRGLQKRHQQWFLGKSIDGFCPMGPAIVTADEIPDISALRLQSHVNGELRQDGRLDDLIFDIPTLIATISRTMTLQPGDVIATGTPAGVGMGFKPPKFLRAGDRVEISADPIGVLENVVG